MKQIAVFSLAASILLSSCATIMGDKTQLIGLNSQPSEATISITDEKGLDIFTGKTPMTVTLQKGDGSYFGGKTYTVKISKDGFTPSTVVINSEVNGWYLAGNLLFGGLIGWFIVDPMTGAMYNLTPEAINQNLSKDQRSGLNGSSLTIALLEDVPANLRDQLVRIK